MEPEIEGRHVHSECTANSSATIHNQQHPEENMRPCRVIIWYRRPGLAVIDFYLDFRTAKQRIEQIARVGNERGTTVRVTGLTGTGRYCCEWFRLAGC